MNLLTKLTNNFFLKQKPDSVFCIALLSNSLVSYFAPASEKKSHHKVVKTLPLFQKKEVKLSNFSKAIVELNVDTPLLGKCHIVLNNQQSQIVQIDKPNVPNNEMIAALKWQVKDLVSIEPENMVLDYFDGPIVSGGKEKIHVVCAPLNELKKIVSTINQTNAEVKSITIEEFAFTHLVPFQNKACLLVCQQPKEDVVLLIVKQGVLYFHRRLRGFSQLGELNGEALLNVLNNLMVEIQRSSDYFERQLKQAPIQTIKVLLPIELESFAIEKLAEMTDVSISLLEMPEHYQEHRDYAAAIGATITGIQHNDNTLLNTQEVANVSE